MKHDSSLNSVIVKIGQAFFIFSTSEITVNRKELWASTLEGQTRENPKLEPLAVLHINYQIYILLVVEGQGVINVWTNFNYVCSYKKITVIYFEWVLFRSSIQKFLRYQRNICFNEQEIVLGEIYKFTFSNTKPEIHQA